ncbi:MAG TPA: type IX secretion system membrane protein PorP/SprF [Flavobacteriales bacterium]|nr:type IX secretion system membrane protein PorP/SprF [Flavobacteriales bacterium]
MLKKNKIPLLIIGVAIAINGFGQQTPQYSQYLFNNYLINPAIGGSGDYLEVKLGSRTQWLGFGAAPTTYLISAHSPVNFGHNEPRKFGDRDHHAMGGYVLKDETGPISNLNFYGSYSYHMRLSYQLRVSFGFFAGIKQYSLNTDGLTTATPDDPDLLSISAITPDAAAGLWMYTKKYFGGLSIQQLLPIPLGGTSNTLRMHYFLTGGYRIRLRKIDSYIIPSTHIKFGLLTPIQADINIKFNYQNTMWAGLAYRKVDALIGIVGFNVRNFFQVGYAFDLTMSKLRHYSSNTHEIIITFRYKPRKRIEDLRCPDFG